MADKPNKPQKLKARRPRGLEDRTAGELAATRAMVETIRAQFERYGFEALETPAIEYTDALGKFLPDQDRPNEGVFSFQDDDEQWLSLRYDLTAPLARYVAENFQNLALPYRSYRQGFVFRNEKPGPGRFRQFMQFDADTVGSASMAADAEMCMLAADTMEALGIPRGSYVVKVNNRKVLDGLLELIDLSGIENAGRRLAVLRAIDKGDKFSFDEVEKLLGDGRKDESGDFTKGAGLSSEQISRIRPLLEYRRGAAAIMTNDPRAPKFASQQEAGNATEPRDAGAKKAKFGEANSLALGYLDAVFFFSEGDHSANLSADEGFRELQMIAELVHSAGYGDRVLIDPSVVRGLEYYTGPVYEVELLLETKDEKGRPVRFGSVGGGGRYDGLVSRFRGEPCPATGFSIGVSRLQAALTLIGKLEAKPQAGPVLVTVFGPDSVASSQALVAKLRNENIRAELYLGNPKHGIGQQLKYADKRHAPCAVIQGPDEKAKGEIIVRDLIAGAAPSDTADRDAHLKKQAEAQTAVAESAMVEAVRKILKNHGLA